MNINEDSEVAYKTRQILNQGLDSLDRRLTDRLIEARQAALNRQRVPVRGMRLAGIGQSVEFAFFAHARSLVAVIALTVGATGTYYWNAFQEASEYEEIDSALLVDDLPPSAYLDHGFHAWLERASNSSSQ